VFSTLELVRKVKKVKLKDGLAYYAEANQSCIRFARERKTSGYEEYL
jgi:hypothetical protein